jgi:hypothetical protein
MDETRPQHMIFVWDSVTLHARLWFVFLSVCAYRKVILALAGLIQQDRSGGLGLVS